MSLARTCLLLIDIQTGLFPTLDLSAASQLEQNIPLLLRTFRQAQARHHASTEAALSARLTENFPTELMTVSMPQSEYSYDISTKDSTDPLVIHVQHHSTLPTSVLSPTSSGVSIHPCAAPLAHETVITKFTNSAFINTNLAALIQHHKIDRLIIAGLVTEHCISTTVRMAANLGVIKRVNETDEEMVKRILLIRDATAAQAKGEWGFDAKTVHEVSLATLDGEFCTVVTTEDVLSRIEAGI